MHDRQSDRLDDCEREWTLLVGATGNVLRTRSGARDLPAVLDGTECIVVVPEERLRLAVETERTGVIARLVEMADALDPDAIAGTAETLRRAAAVLALEGGGR